MKIFSKLLWANYKQFIRDRMALFFTFAFPVVFMIIFGLVFSGTDDFQYTVGLVDNDKSMVSNQIADNFAQIPIFEIETGELDSELDRLKAGDIRAVMVIPEGVETSLGMNLPVQLVLYYDPSQSTSIQIIQPVIRDFVNVLNQQITAQPFIVSLSEESIQSQELSNIDFLVPGVVAMSIMFLGLFSALPLIQQREKKILKRLGATPLKRSSIIYSQVFFRLVLALTQTGIIIALAYFAFDVNMLGSWLVLLGLVLLGTLTFISMGYLIASFARTEEGAMPIIQLIQFPMLFLSGVFFPIEFLPDFMKPIVQALPLTYLGDGFRQIMVEATPLNPLGIDVLVLLGWIIVCLSLSLRFFRWE